MITPFKSGSELVTEIDSTQPTPGQLAVWWLGQSGYLIKSRSGTLLIDPYLSEHLSEKYAGTVNEHIRMTAAPCRGDDLEGINLIVGSHKHSDHIDPGTLPGLMASSAGARLVVPAALVDHTINLGLPADRVIGIEVGEIIEDSGFRVRAVPAAHESLETDSLGRHLYLGFVIEADGRRLYHSGDTMLYDSLSEAIGPAPLDAMFLPINGRDPARGVAGNMSPAEAVDLALRLRPRFVVPHHYDMFTFNTVPVDVFRNEAARLPVGTTAVVLRCAERWEIHP